MICGSGMLARYFEKINNNNNDVIFFCSGVSDFTSNDFNREKNCLLSLPKEKFIVYSSSLCVVSQKTEYQKHKFYMEKIIENNFQNYLIFRVGNLVGHNQNKNQFFPNIVNQIKNKKVLIHNYRRDLLLASDYVKIVSSMLNYKNRVLSLCSSKPPHVLSIVEEIEKYIGYSNKEYSNFSEINYFYKPSIITGDEYYYKKVIKNYFDKNYEILH